MKTIKQKEDGFSAVEILLVLVIIVLIGAVGWLIYRNHHKTNSAATTSSSSSKTAGTNPTSTATTTTNPYAGWKTFCSNSGGVCIKYPVSWSLKQTLYPQGSAAGSESDIITSPSGKVAVDLEPDGAIGGCAGNEITSNVVSVVPITSYKLENVQIAEKTYLDPSTYVYNVVDFVANQGALADGPNSAPFTTGAVISSTYGSDDCVRFSTLEGTTAKVYLRPVYTQAEQQSTSLSSFATLPEAKAWFNSSEVKDGNLILQSVSLKS